MCPSVCVCAVCDLSFCICHANRTCVRVCVAGVGVGVPDATYFETSAESGAGIQALFTEMARQLFERHERAMRDGGLSRRHAQAAAVGGGGASVDVSGSATQQQTGFCIQGAC